MGLDISSVAGLVISTRGVLDVMAYIAISKCRRIGRQDRDSNPRFGGGHQSPCYRPLHCPPPLISSPGMME